MTVEPNTEDRVFIATCRRLNLLHETDANLLLETIENAGGVIAQTALQKGLLSPADVDIVQSIQHPTETVPGYKILELIGRGGMGVVYRAEQLDLERIVALKTILISNIHDPTVAARFEREAKTLARLHHPNIVQALNFGKHDGRYFFAMEFVDGYSCEQKVQSLGRIPPGEAWGIVRQVASGLLHANSQEVIHRDIKPANLLLMPPPEGSKHAGESVKIADFGLAMLAEQSTEKQKLTTGNKILGSPAYMSLEQLGGQDVDFRSDIYSLGVTAWHLMFGKPPFLGGSISALFQQKSQPLSVDMKSLPTDLRGDQLDLLVKMLDPKPDHRPQSYEQLIDAIDEMDCCSSEVETLSADRIRSDARRSAITQFPTPIRSTSVEREASEDRAGIAMQQTLDLSTSSTDRPRSFPVKSISVIACVIAIVAGIFLYQAWAHQRGPRSHTKVASQTALFDGETLSGWDVGGSMVGAWNTITAPDSSTAIACLSEKGALTRRFPESEHPRISLFVWLQENARAVDIDFALDTTIASDKRGCLRLTNEFFQLGVKSDDFGDLDVVESREQLTSIHERYHVLHIERQPDDWFVFLEEKLVGTIPVDQIGPGNAFRLVVHEKADGENKPQAYFADLQHFSLQ